MVDATTLMVFFLSVRERYRITLQKLRTSPSNVDEFMTLMQAMADTQERYEGMMERREFVSDLYLLLAEHRMAVSEDDRASHMMLAAVSTRVKAAVQDVEENADANITRFSKELAVAIPRLRRCDRGGLCDVVCSFVSVSCCLPRAWSVPRRQVACIRPIPHVTSDLRLLTALL